MAEKSNLRVMSEDEIEKLEEQDELEDKHFMEMLAKKIRRQTTQCYGNLGLLQTIKV